MRVGTGLKLQRVNQLKEFGTEYILEAVSEVVIRHFSSNIGRVPACRGIRHKDIKNGPA
jgi:hypothetical protein